MAAALVRLFEECDAAGKLAAMSQEFLNNSEEFSSDVFVRLERLFAPRMSIHGTLMDIQGIGTLIRGDSGIGKSECALALIDHGHSLVADDHVYCVKVNDQSVLGRGHELNRGYMECRGIGIINVAELLEYGACARRNR